LVPLRFVVISSFYTSSYIEKTSVKILNTFTLNVADGQFHFILIGSTTHMVIFFTKDIPDLVTGKFCKKKYSMHFLQV